VSDPTDMRRSACGTRRLRIRATAKKAALQKGENVVTIGIELERQPSRAFPNDLPRDRLRSKGRNAGKTFSSIFILGAEDLDQLKEKWGVP